MVNNNGLKPIGICKNVVFSNQLMAFSDSDFNVSRKLAISLEVAYILLSSAKLARLALFINEKKSFMNKLNRTLKLNLNLVVLLKLIFLLGFQCYVFQRFLSFFLNMST